MTKHEQDQRIGELCRNGRTVYYAIFGKAMVESYSRSDIVAALSRHEHKLPEWDQSRR